MFKKNLKGVFLIVLVAFFGTACAAQKPPELLVRARENFSRAELQKAAELAPDEYLEAKKALDLAEASYASGDYATIVNHRCVVANARTEIALLGAQEKANQKRIDDINLRKADILRRKKEANELLRAQQELLKMKDHELHRRGKDIRDLDQKVAMTNAQLKALEAERDKMRADLTKAVSEVGRIRETKRGLIVSLSNILFEFNKADLKPGNQQNLEQIARLLREYPDRNILIEGHTDNVGTSDYNQALSERRARSVEEFMERQGLSPKSIAVKGYGERFPLTTNDTAEGRQQNRRVDIVILNAEQKAQDNFLDGKNPAEPNVTIPSGG